MREQVVTANLQREICMTCEARLGRPLSQVELNFVMAHRGFLALELIRDTVSDMTADELSEYLNSEGRSEPGDDRRAWAEWAAKWE